MAITQLIFLIVLVIGVAGVVIANSYLKILRENQGQIGSLEKEFGARLARLESMEERIRVLEAIVTDRRFELEKQLSELDKAG